MTGPSRSTEPYRQAYRIHESFVLPKGSCWTESQPRIKKSEVMETTGDPKSRNCPNIFSFPSRTFISYVYSRMVYKALRTFTISSVTKRAHSNT